jgi:hypothetical protein
MTDQPRPSLNPAQLVARGRAFIDSLSPRQKLIGGGVIVLVFVLLLIVTGNREPERYIYINGYLLSQQEAAYLDASMGARVPNGHYWLDPQSMSWGAVGNAQSMGAMGYYDPGQMQMQAPAQQWYDAGQNYRGPFGDYMSDGQCSFVNEVPVGNC